MNFDELQKRLQGLTNKKISQAEIGRILGVSRSNIHDRIKRNSSVTIEEAEIIQEALGIKFLIYAAPKYIDNSLTLRFDDTIDEKLKTCGARIKEIQKRNKLSDIQTARLLDISEKELAAVIEGSKLPDTRTLNNLKQNFNISIDWLLYGG